MTKLEFLNILRSKLGILNADEINDIIDEYSGYIDSKIAEGKTEEEAVADFGDIDDLAAEILDAYKINREYTKDRQNNSGKSKARSHSATLDDMMNSLGEILNQTIDYATRFFENVFKDYSVESLAQLLVIILVAIIIIAMMKIPFFIIEAIGRGFIHFILPYRLAKLLIIAWEILVNSIYFLIAILVIVGLIQGIMEKKDINESIRDMFKRSHIHIWKKTRQDYGKQRNESVRPATKTIIVEADSTAGAKEKNDSAHEPDFENEADQKSNDAYEKHQEETMYRYNDTRDTPRRGIDILLNVLMGIIKIIVLLVLLPFYGAVIALAAALGILIYLLFQKVWIIGFVILAIGLMSLIGTFTSFIWYLLDRRKSYRLHSFKASVLTASVLLGFGAIFSFFDVMRFEYVPNPEIFTVFEEKKNFYYDLADHEQTFDFDTHQILLVEDPSLTDGRLKIQVQYRKGGKLEEFSDGNTVDIVYHDFDSNFDKIQYVAKTVIEGLKQNKIYALDSYQSHVVYVHASKTTLAKLNLVYNTVIYQP